MILTQFAGPRTGVTLIELLVTVALMAVLVSISLPTVTTELDALRLRSASQATAATLNAALMTAEQRQEAVEITVSVHERRISTRSVLTNATLCLDLPEGIEISSNSGESRFMVYPDGTIPAIKVSLKNRKGVGRQIWVNPVSGVVHDKAYQPGS